MYVCIYIYIYLYTCIYVYNLPPLIRNPPNKKPPLGGGNKHVTINLDGGTITPLIRNDGWSNLPPILKIGGFVDARKSADL